MWTTIHREVTKKLVCLFLAVSEEKQKSKTRDFPGGPVAKALFSSAGFDPWSGN